jgi:hypothetical protein
MKKLVGNIMEHLKIESHKL